jgi:hypothetical protein
MYILKMEICFQYIFLYPFSHPFPLLFIMDHFFLFSMKSINRYKWKYAMCSCSGINHKKSKSVKQTWKGAEISVPGTGEICEESRQTPQCLSRTHHQILMKVKVREWILIFVVCKTRRCNLIPVTVQTTTWQGNVRGNVVGRQFVPPGINKSYRRFNVLMV